MQPSGIEGSVDFTFGNCEIEILYSPVSDLTSSGFNLVCFGCNTCMVVVGETLIVTGDYEEYKTPFLNLSY